ncbi:MAG: hypothetical protein AAGK21_12650 [Bacteroidota bacterium]
MQYPLDLSFKIVAIAPQIRVTDAAGAPIFHVHQKAFKIKEAVKVYRDETKQTVLYTIEADRVLDFNAAYLIKDGTGRVVGTLVRQGRRSLWRARYDVLNAEGESVFRIHEDNPWKKVLDGLLGDVPFASYFINPSYSVEYDDPDTPEREGTPVMKLQKKRAFFEGRFSLDRTSDLPTEHEELVILAVLMMVLRERSRG